MNFKNAHELLELCSSQGMDIGQVMVQREITVLEHSQEETFQRMRRAYSIMKDAAGTARKTPQKTMGGLIGGEASRLEKRRLAGQSICGSLMARAISCAMGVLEVNASMGLIVAAPTAGSSGVLPGVLLALQEEHGLTDEDMLPPLFCAAAVGYLISRNATVAGAEGGCQAEVGAASAMAAAAAVQLMGGTPEQCLRAASTALANILGLVCDPIGGLVEAPCQSRNAMGASNALISAELALADAALDIPFDEMVDAMLAVGKSMPSELRETALGGVAACPSFRSRGVCKK